jgi:tetratricopeptide (TPR) repeat protein
MLQANKKLNLALQHHRRGDLRQAEILYRQVIEHTPNHSDALHLLGFLAIQTGRYEEAVHCIGKAIQCNGKSAKLYANLAVALQNLCKNEEAINACLKAIELEPDNFTAYNTLGNAFRGQGSLEQAVESFQKAISIKPDTVEVYVNLGVVLRELGRIDEAEECFKKAVILKKDYAEAYFNLGILYRSRDNLDEAASNLLKAVENNPKFAEACNILGNVLTEQDKLNAAVACYQQALHIKPDYVEACYNLGNVFTTQEKFHEAVTCYCQVLIQKPDFAEAYCKLGYAFLKLEKPDEAAKSYLQALAVKPDTVEAYNGFGNVLREGGKPEEALKMYQKALAIKPDFVEVHYNISNAFFDQGRLDEAIESCQKALIIRPDLAEAHWNMALALLAKGNFIQGWKKYEWRFLKRGASPPPFPYPRWDGSSLKDKTLFVFAEQGIGDEIMFASCLQEVINAADLCIVECDKRLVPLFSRSFPGAEVIARIGTDDFPSTKLPPADIKIAVGSLPIFLRPDFASFPQQKAYLLAKIQQVDEWHNRFAALGTGLKVGISWRGGKGYVRRIRSTTLDQWKKLFLMPGVHFINLQYGDVTAELEEVKEKLDVIIHHWEAADPLKDLDGFAAKISALDMVISVDNSTVHMSGALGVPVWTLLPFACDWRWMQEFEDTPWYHTMRLFRQKNPGNWDEVFDQVATVLKNMIGKKDYERHT